MQIERSPKNSINYLFFGFYFFAVSLIHLFHVFLIEPSASFSTCFFLIYALAQTTLETLILIILAHGIQTHLPRYINGFVLFVFFFFLTHVIDFPLVRLMDLSFWGGLNVVTQESYENFIELLIASNISIYVWSAAAVGCIALFFSGLALFKITKRFTDRRPLLISFRLLGASVCFMGLFLLTWDYSAREYVAKSHFERFQKTLPWKNTFLPQKIDLMALTHPLRPAGVEEDLLKKIDARAFSLPATPDIFLFIVESLREDFIEEKAAPHLTQFKKENLSFKMALSNANATQISWFSLFHSLMPFHWGKKEIVNRKVGSLPLRLLKKMGYKIHINSSARLSFYQMERILFGERAHLADTLFTPDEAITELHVRDQMTMGNLHEQMSANETGGGRLFITFLDATHHDYSWPKVTDSHFYPYEEEINYLKAAVSRQCLEGIKNRYRNALHFVDSLFGSFLAKLNSSVKGQDAVIVFLGDHGEEFYEQGNLFHASGLSHQQMHIPLYYRFGQNHKLMKECTCELTTHVDVFPSLFHYLIGEDLFSEIFHGESVFKSKRWPYVITGRFNASRAPFEFSIHNGKEKLVAEFTNDRDIFNSKGLRILSKKNLNDEMVATDIHSIQEEYDSAFEKLFIR